MEAKFSISPKARRINEKTLIVAVDLGKNSPMGYCRSPDGREVKPFRFSTNRKGFDFLWKTVQNAMVKYRLERVVVGFESINCYGEPLRDFLKDKNQGAREKNMEPKILLPPYKVEYILEEIRDEEIEELEGALDRGKTEIDPVTFSVVYARLEGIMSEMTETILATARNPILYGAKDFTCTLMNARAKVLSMFDCLPVHVGTLGSALRFVIRAFQGDIREGDVFVNNASYAGNAHVGDWTMFAPIFHDGRFVAWAVNKCHIIDTGAHLPTNVDFFAKDVY